MTALRYRRARELAGLSLAQAARLLGIERALLEQAEEGRVRVSGFERAMAETYGCSLDWLRGADPVVPESTRKMIRDADLNSTEREDLLELIGSIGTRSKP